MESFGKLISCQHCIVCVLNFLTRLKIWNNNLHLSFTVPWRHKAIPPINSSKSIVPFCNRKERWETFNTRLLPNGCPVARGVLRSALWRPKFQTRSPHRCLKRLILKPTSSQLTTKFTANSALMKQKHKTFGHQL